MSWSSIIPPFLVGAATGGWWSRRKAVASAFAAGHAEAKSQAIATGGSVVIGLPDSQGGLGRELGSYLADDGTPRYLYLNAPGELVERTQRVSRGSTSDGAPDLVRRVGDRGEALDSWESLG